MGEPKPYGVETRKARKEHECSLCFGTIQPDEEYIYQRMTPWDHPENEEYFDYKAHKSCDQIWREVAPDFDYMIPMDEADWSEMVGEHGV